MKTQATFEKIYFVLFDDQACEVFLRAWKRMQTDSFAAGGRE